MLGINDFLLLLTRLLFILIGLLTLLDFLRHRSKARLDIALMFGTLAFISTIGVLETIFILPYWLTKLISILLISQPYLLLRLVLHFRLVLQAIQWGAIAGMIISWFVLLLIPGELPTLLTLALVAYLVAYQSYAAWFFVEGAFTSRGVRRRRLMLAATGSFFLTLAIFMIALMEILPEQVEQLTPFFLSCAILSALSYYLGFAAPRWLRLTWQQSELQYFLHQMTEQPVNVRASISGQLLCEGAVRSVGAVAAVATRWDEEKKQLKFWASEQMPWVDEKLEKLCEEIFDPWVQEKQPGKPSKTLVTKPDKQMELLATALGTKALMLVPICTTEEVWGLLFVFLRHPSLFISDDLTLLKLMAQQSTFTLDYEASLEEQRTLVKQLRFLQEVTQEMNQAADFNAALQVILKNVCLMTGWSYGEAKIPNQNGEFLFFCAAWLATKELESFKRLRETLTFAPNVGLAGRVWFSKKAEWVEQLLESDSERFYHPDSSQKAAFEAALAVPIISDEEVLAVLIFLMSESHQEDRRLFEIVKTAATQLGTILRRKQVEEALKQAHDELERRVEERTAKLTAANAELEQFAYIVSHDLRAPLRAMKSYAQFLSEDFREELDDFGMEYVKGIAESAEQMDNLVVDLLEYSRIGRSQVKLEEVELNQLLKRLVRQLGYGEGEINLPTDAPKVKASSVRLEQIFANLLSNGIKFCHKDVKPLITVSWSDEADAWHFSVRDNGIGIQKKHLEKIFGIFQRLHTQEEYEGTGVGLAIVKKAVLEHGGQIWVESEIGRGSTFTFSLPKKE